MFSPRPSSQQRVASPRVIEPESQPSRPAQPTPAPKVESKPSPPAIQLDDPQEEAKPRAVADANGEPLPIEEVAPTLATLGVDRSANGCKPSKKK